nr:hypothetical protein [Tanacetum cinerariifolium]
MIILGTSLGDALQKVLQIHTEELIQQYPQKHPIDTHQQPKYADKSIQAEKTVFKAADTDIPFNQGDKMGNTDEQPDVKAAPKADWFKKPQRAPTLDPKLAHNWLNDLANAENPPLTFNDLMSTPIDFSAFSMNRLKISDSLLSLLCLKLINITAGPSRLCTQAQSGDDILFHKQAYMEYTQLVFCKLFGMPREHHRACPTRMHDSLLLSFQGYVLKHGLIPPPEHLFRGDTGLLNVHGVPRGSIVASLENVNGFLAVYTPSDDLISTDFKQKRVVSEIVLYTLKEFAFLLGRDM